MQLDGEGRGRAAKFSHVRGSSVYTEMCGEYQAEIWPDDSLTRGPYCMSLQFPPAEAVDVLARAWSIGVNKNLPIDSNGF